MIDQTTVRDECKQKEAVRKRLRDLRLALETAQLMHEAAANGYKSGSASMSLRKIHDLLVGDARNGYCRDALYRSEEADNLIKSKPSSKLLARSLPDGKTPIHCEHTIPVNVVVRQLWYLNRANKQLGERQRDFFLLEQLFRLAVVTACSQRERRCREGLARLRAYDSEGPKQTWSRHHPQFTPGCEWSADLLPFLRYSGTSVRVLHANSKEQICPERFKLQDHWDLLGRSSHLSAAYYFEDVPHRPIELDQSGPEKR